MFCNSNHDICFVKFSVCYDLNLVITLMEVHALLEVHLVNKKRVYTLYSERIAFHFSWGENHFKISFMEVIHMEDS